MKITDKFGERFSDKLIWGFIFIYISAFCCICFQKYHSFGYYDWDFASDTTILWNSVHGRIFYYPFLEQIIFGAHLYLIIVLLIPVYAVFQHPLTLLFLQSIFLGLAAYPLYLLAGLKLNKTFALVISLVYLLYPSLGFINLFETHFEIYTIFFLFFAIYYFEKEACRKFLIFIFLAIICKENVSLVIFMFGFYAFLRRRSKRWVLVPCLLGVIWFFLAVKIVIPYFAKDAELYQGGFIFTLYYQHLGRNIFDMIKTIVTHPIAIARYAFTQRKILYLFKLFVPTGFLGFLSPAPLLIILPILMQNLLSWAPTHSSIRFQYVALLIPFIFYSVICAFRKVLNCNTKYERKIALLLLFLIVAIASGIYLGAPQLFLAKYIKMYRIGDFAKEKDKLVRLIPGDASVIATFQFLPKLAHRHDLYSMHLVSTGFKMYTKVKYEPPANLEYALIDFNEPLMIASFFPPQAPTNIRSFLEGENWRVLRATDDIVLFKKGYLEGHKLCEVAQNPEIENTINANIGNQIMFLGYDVVDENKDGGGILHLAYYWKATNQINNDPGLLVQFLDSDNRVIFQKFHALGYRVYLPKGWFDNRIVKEHHYIRIPSGVKKGCYNIRVVPFCTRKWESIAVLNKKVTDIWGRIVLGDVSIGK